MGHPGCSPCNRWALNKSRLTSGPWISMMSWQESPRPPYLTWAVPCVMVLMERRSCGQRPTKARQNPTRQTKGLFSSVLGVLHIHGEKSCWTCWLLRRAFDHWWIVEERVRVPRATCQRVLSARPSRSKKAVTHGREGVRPETRLVLQGPPHRFSECDCISE
jgi:hypothetical protein